MRQRERWRGTTTNTKAKIMATSSPPTMSTLPGCFSRMVALADPRPGEPGCLPGLLAQQNPNMGHCNVASPNCRWRVSTKIKPSWPKDSYSTLALDCSGNRRRFYFPIQRNLFPIRRQSRSEAALMREQNQRKNGDGKRKWRLSQTGIRHFLIDTTNQFDEPGGSRRTDRRNSNENEAREAPEAQPQPEAPDHLEAQVTQTNYGYSNTEFNPNDILCDPALREQIQEYAPDVCMHWLSVAMFAQAPENFWVRHWMVAF